MRYLDLFDSAITHCEGGAHYRDEPAMLFERAVYMSAPGALVRLRAGGRALGIVFHRHAWSGIVSLRIGDELTRIDLYSADPATWAYEFTLPADREQDLQIEVLGEINPLSHGREVWLQGIYVSEYLTSEVPDLLLDHVGDEPLREAQLNQLTDVFKWYDADWRAALQDIVPQPVYQPPDFVHRKSWEWSQCLFGLRLLNKLHPDASALGVGVGWEPLSYYFANLLQKVVATDLYPVEHMWSEHGAREGNPRILEDPDTYAPFAYRRDHLQFLRMDGKVLEFPDESFDLVWSCSSIEHFGGHGGAAAAMREIERVLKPGGVVAMITEYVLPDPVSGRHVLFDKEYFYLRCVYEYLVRPVPGLRLVQPLDLAIPEYYVRRALRLPDDAQAPHDGSGRPHIVLRSPSGALHTSIALFFRKEPGFQPSRRTFAAPATQLAAARPAPLPTAPAVGALEQHAASLSQSTSPLFAAGSDGVKDIARSLLNAVIGVVNRPQLGFARELRSTIELMVRVLRAHDDVLARHEAAIARLERTAGDHGQSPGTPPPKK